MFLHQTTSAIMSLDVVHISSSLKKTSFHSSRFWWSISSLCYKERLVCHHPSGSKEFCLVDFSSSFWMTCHKHHGSQAIHVTVLQPFFRLQLWETGQQTVIKCAGCFLSSMLTSELRLLLSSITQKRMSECVPPTSSNKKYVGHFFPDSLTKKWWLAGSSTLPGSLSMSHKGWFSLMVAEPGSLNIPSTSMVQCPYHDSSLSIMDSWASPADGSGSSIGKGGIISIISGYPPDE